jgi:hypothetical protein
MSLLPDDAHPTSGPQRGYRVEPKNTKVGHHPMTAPTVKERDERYRYRPQQARMAFTCSQGLMNARDE